MRPRKALFLYKFGAPETYSETLDISRRFGPPETLTFPPSEIGWRNLKRYAAVSGLPKLHRNFTFFGVISTALSSRMTNRTTRCRVTDLLASWISDPAQKTSEVLNYNVQEYN